MLSNWTVLHDPLLHELDRTLAAFARPAPARHAQRQRVAGRRAGPWARRTDDGGSYLVSVDLPGVRAADLTVEIEGRILTLTAPRADERGAYRHAFTLPDDANPAGAAADLADGVLTLTIPRRAEDQPRRIAVTAAGQLPAPAEG